MNVYILTPRCKPFLSLFIYSNTFTLRGYGFIFTSLTDVNMEMMKPIIKQKTRILTPYEYKAIRKQLNQHHRLLFDGLIFTGMRGTEFDMFMNNLDWFNSRRQCISLPSSAILKAKTKFRERDVLLSDMGVRAIEDLSYAITKDGLGSFSRQAWGQDLKRAARKAELPIIGIIPKMTRKTCVSWLVSALSMSERGNTSLLIAASMGHDIQTMMQHYLSISFSPQERADIETFTRGWGGIQ